MFSRDFAKFLRTSFFTEHLQWLLLIFQITITTIPFLYLVLNNAIDWYDKWLQTSFANLQFYATYIWVWVSVTFAYVYGPVLRILDYSLISWACI